jgi:RNA-directed DNA polymerase
MTHQQSEGRVVGEGGATPAEPLGSPHPPRQPKAASVEREVEQLELSPTTAENPEGPSSEGPAHDSGPDLSGSLIAGEPKVGANAETCPPATMEEVARQLDDALRKVAQNKGAPGPDGQTIAELQAQWSDLRPRLEAALLDGSHRPGEIRRVGIPKPGGGERELGIPNVVDRVVQEAFRAVLEPLWEPTFHPSSHGFRPNRSPHTAIAEAKRHLKDGREWVVDIDLESFFDRVNHQRLLARLATRVSDKRLLAAIGRMLKAAVVMPDGVVIGSEQGTPQGSPLSPLLSNVVLDELDSELDRRGHRFCRYADDVSVFVASERAGQRVMASTTRFIEGRMRLRVNRKKSATARPEDRQLLGFRLRKHPETGEVTMLLAERTKRRAMARIRELTPRNWGGSLDSCINGANAWLGGWFGYFGIAAYASEQDLRALDAHLRRRLRAIFCKQAKRRRTLVRKLIALGVPADSAWRGVYGAQKGPWALSHTPAVDRGLPNAYWARRGLVSLVGLRREMLEDIAAPGQLPLGLAPG